MIRRPNRRTNPPDRVSPRSTAQRRFTWPAGLIIACSMLAASVPAEARKKRAVVLNFSGPVGRKATIAYAKSIRRRVKILGERVYLRAADDLAVDDETPEGRSAICSRLRCAAVVVGKVRKRRRRLTLTITVFDGSSGEVIGRKVVRARGARKLARAAARVGKQTLPLIQQGSFGRAEAAPPPIAAEQGQSADDEGEEAESPDEQEEEEEETDEEEETGDDEQEENQSTRVEASDEAAPQVASLLDLSAGIGIATRTYELTSAAAAAPNRYEGGAYPEMVLRADLYPLARSMRGGFASNLGIGVSYSRHLSISTKLSAQSGEEVEIDTSSQELLLELRYRNFLYATGTAFVLGAHAGYGLRDFDLGLSGTDSTGAQVDNNKLRSFNYRFLRVGVLMAYPLGSPLIALHAGFDVRPLLSVGSEAVNAYGAHGGSFGFALRGGLSGRHSSGFFYTATFELLSFSTDFDGLGDVPADQLLPGDQKDPTSGSDRFLRIWLGTGYAL